MSETLVVSGRGQITLPAALRKRLGIKEGDVVILEERGNEVLLKPGAVFEIGVYSEGEIDEWDKADELSEEERGEIVKRLRTPKR
ncbi:MAG: AbrB/MazE/SpoVT family DNA-binding domain-containing protein [Sedimenticolaceae bacterium]